MRRPRHHPGYTYLVFCGPRHSAPARARDSPPSRATHHRVRPCWRARRRAPPRRWRASLRPSPPRRGCEALDRATGTKTPPPRRRGPRRHPLRIRARLNGDFGSAYVGHATRPCDYDTFDDFLEIACEKASAETIGRNDLAGDATGSPLSKADEATCLAADGARAFDARGNRLRSIDDLLRLARSQPGVVGYPAHFITNDNSWDSRAAADVWVVPATVHFVWPTVRTGHVTRTELRDEITGADAGHSSVVTTLSMRPQVFRISQFMLEHECESIIERNKPRIKPSEVGLVGRAGDRTRTSTNAWDTSSPTARDAPLGRAMICGDRPCSDSEETIRSSHYVA